MFRLFFHRHEPGQPCPHMEAMLNDAADGRARGFRRWYALAHAARCGPCRRFLGALEANLTRLRQAREAEPTPEVLQRLELGRWRTVESPDDFPQT